MKKEVRDSKDRLIAKCVPKEKIEIKDSKKKITWDIVNQTITVRYKGDLEETVIHDDGSKDNICLIDK